MSKGQNIPIRLDCDRSSFDSSGALEKRKPSVRLHLGKCAGVSMRHRAATGGPTLQTNEHDNAWLALFGCEGRLPGIQHVAELREDGLQQQQHRSIDAINEMHRSPPKSH